MAEHAAPLPPGERIQEMDALRGFALFGILVVNILFFSGPMQQNFMQPWIGAPDGGLRGAVLWLFQGKFYCLFSFLFGMGFSVQTARIAARGASAGRIYSRRLLVLLAIGLAHGLLVWMGDILAIYALVGFLLLAFRRRRDKTLLVWAACLLGLMVLFYLFLWLLMLLITALPAAAPELAKAEAAQAQDTTRRLAEALQAYGHGPYGLLFRVRLRELLTNYGMTLMLLPQILAMFLLGAWAGRKGILQAPGQHRRLLVRVALAGLLLGLPANAWYAWSMGHGMPGPKNPTAFLAFALFAAAAPALSLGYAAALVLGFQRPALEGVRRALAAPGRMALSSYLTHSVVLTTVFYFYGLGWYGQLGLPAALGTGLLLFALQVPASMAWLGRHAMGPAEWLWRRLTYGAPDPVQ